VPLGLDPCAAPATEAARHREGWVACVPAFTGNHAAEKRHAAGPVIIVPTTDGANIEELYPSQVPLKKGDGGLTKDSVALCEQV